MSTGALFKPGIFRPAPASDVSAQDFAGPWTFTPDGATTGPLLNHTVNFVVGDTGRPVGGWIANAGLVGLGNVDDWAATLTLARGATAVVTDQAADIDDFDTTGGRMHVVAQPPSGFATSVVAVTSRWTLALPGNAGLIHVPSEPTNQTTVRVNA